MSKLFKLHKLFKEEQQIKSSSSKISKEKSFSFSSNNKTISSLSTGGLFHNGNSIKGGKVSNGNTTTQKVIVIAKSYNSGYNSKTKTVKTNKQAGASASKHLDYINKEDRNEERSMIIEQFDNALDNEIYSFSKGEIEKIKIENLEKDLEKNIKNGKIESTFSFEADDKILDNKELLKDISKNNKLYIENEASTGKVKIHLKGNKESLALALNKLNKAEEKNFKREDIKDIKTNIYNKHGEQLTYENFNKKKKDLKEKGIRGVLSLEVSPKDNLSSEELKAVVKNVIEQMEDSMNKNFDWNFTIHTNTKHTHAHIDILSDNGAINFSKAQLEAFKTISTKSILEVEDYSKNHKMENSHQEFKQYNFEEKLESAFIFNEEKIIKNDTKRLLEISNETSTEKLDKIAEKSTNKEVLKAVIENSNVSNETLIKLSDDKSVEIINKALDKLEARVELSKQIENDNERGFEDSKKNTENKEETTQTNKRSYGMSM